MKIKTAVANCCGFFIDFYVLKYYPLNSLKNKELCGMKHDIDTYPFGAG